MEGCLFQMPGNDHAQRTGEEKAGTRHAASKDKYVHRADTDVGRLHTRIFSFQITRTRLAANEQGEKVTPKIFVTMSIRILEAIEKKRDELRLVGRSIISARVHRILSNYNTIKGRNFSRQQIYRLAGREEDVNRPGVLETMFDFYASAEFASAESGRMIVSEIGSWPVWAKAAREEISTTGFWKGSERLNLLLGELRLAHVRGDHSEAIRICGELRAQMELVYLAVANEADKILPLGK